jgi:general secretion pathway protein K
VIRRAWREAGSALLLALWCVAVLSVTVLAVAKMVLADVDDAALQNRRFEGRELALTGLAYGLHPKMEIWDPLLDQRFPDGRKLRVRVTSEGAKLDINRQLRERGQATLRRLFTNWGLTSPQISTVVDSMIDWIDPDEQPLLNGAERTQIAREPQYSPPANRDFRSVGEMEKVRGMDVVAAAKPDWARYFTIHGGRRIDLQEASIDVMRAAANLSLEQARQIDEARTGADHLPQTRDDLKIKNIGQFLESMGLPPAQRTLALTKFAVGLGPTRIESKATVGRTDYTVSAVVARGASGGDGALLNWDER